MNTILGGQFSSRINLNLREAKGFTYGANSAFSYYQDSGLFEINTAVNIENTGAALKEILKEINGIRTEITEKEIDFAKSYLIKQYPARFETYSQIAKNIESLIVHSLPFDELTNYVENLASQNRENILSSAIQNILPDELVIVMCGEKGKIVDQLKIELNVIPVELDIEGNLII
jgi:zinc protease